MSQANDKQVGGGHYQDQALQHWDLVDMYKWDYFQAQIIKYVMRHNRKNGLEDLQKAIHFLEKYIEVKYPHGGLVPQGEDECTCGGKGLPKWIHQTECPLYFGPGTSYVDQD